MAIHLVKPKPRFHTNPSLIHLFSTTSSSQSPPQNEDETSDSKVSSYFSSVRSTLQKKPQTHLPSPPSLDLTDIRKNLNEFRKRSSVPATRGGLQELNGSRKQESLNFDNIKENLRQMRPSSSPSSSLQGSGFESKWSNLSSFKSIKSENREGLPYSVFGGELKEEKRKEKEEMMPKTEFFRSYGAKELGEKLRMFRPEGMMKEEGWFSLQELNQRLVKLREVEEEAAKGTRTGLQFEGLRGRGRSSEKTCLYVLKTLCLCVSRV